MAVSISGYLDIFLVLASFVFILLTAVDAYRVGRISGFFRAWKRKVYGYFLVAIGVSIICGSILTAAIYRMVVFNIALIFFLAGWILIWLGMRELRQRIRDA